MKDLGTLGGDNSEAIWINDAGEIAGSADLPGDELQHAVRWKDGRILDLGTVSGDACSRSRAINERGQIVGGSSDCRNILHAFLWEEGGPMIDLNTVIPPGSGLQLTSAFNINDRGEIVAKSDLGHVVLLVPCEEDRGDCVNTLASASGAALAVNDQAFRSSSSLSMTHNNAASETLAAFRAQALVRQRRGFGSWSRK
jgi:probable HAF family extracellular repeat protein